MAPQMDLYGEAYLDLAECWAYPWLGAFSRVSVCYTKIGDEGATPTNYIIE